MSQRNSEYKRQANDLYETPEWVTQALIPHLPYRIRHIWEPAAGNRKMSKVLLKNYSVTSTDITTGTDFLQTTTANQCDAIVTNPPFNRAQEFIEHALELMKPVKGVVAMLLHADFDHAKTRRHLFAECSQFSKRLVLTKRIVWFERKGAAPSSNHSWWIWDYKNLTPPTIVYDFQE